MLRDAWDDIKLRVSISRLYWLYMQNNTILIPIHDEKIYTENMYLYGHWTHWAVHQLLQILKIFNLKNVMLNCPFVNNEQLDLS